MTRTARLLFALLISALSLTGVVTDATAATPVASRVCDASGNCARTIRVDSLTKITFTTTVTCAGTGRLTVTIRAYKSSGAHSTSPAKVVTCSPGGSTTYSTGLWGDARIVVGYRVILNAVTQGSYVGAAIPPSHPASGGFGLRWDQP